MSLARTGTQTVCSGGKCTNYEVTRPTYLQENDSKLNFCSNHECVLFYQGYQGLVDGGDNIKEAKWEEMSGIIELV